MIQPLFLGPVQHKKILVARGNNTWDRNALSCHLQELEALVKGGEDTRIRAKMQEIVPEYNPLPQDSPSWAG